MIKECTPEAGRIAPLKWVVFAFVVLAGVVGTFAATGSEQVYYDAEWKRVHSKEAAEYIRVIRWASGPGAATVVEDYFVTGELQGRGQAIHVDRDDDANSLWRGELETYYRSGQLESQKYFDEEGRPEGAMRSWYEDGTLQDEMTFRFGKPHGKSRQWYPSGALSSEANFKVGRPHGPFAEYYENGSLWRRLDFSNGNPTSRYFIWCDEFESCESVFLDEFDDNSNEWPIVELPQFETELVEEGLRLRNKAGKGFAEWIHLPIELERDFSIEATLNLQYGDGDTSYGLIFGFLDWENYLYFVVSRNGYYRTGAMVEGVLVEFTEWTASEAVNQGDTRNLLKVFKSGDELFFSLNGRVIDSHSFPGFRGNYLGAWDMSGKNEILMERFRVKVSRSYAEAVAGLTDDDRAETWARGGSGFLVTTDGLLVTNHHVTEDAGGIEVELVREGRQRTYDAVVVLADEQNDLAVVRIVDPDFVPLSRIRYSFASRSSETGAEVFTLGFPLTPILGEGIKFTDGSISSKTGFKGEITTYQVSVPVQPGSSGGPLFDEQANLVGVISAKIHEAENVSYAIKSDYVRALLGALDPPVELPDDHSLEPLSKVDKIRELSSYVALIRVR